MIHLFQSINQRKRLMILFAFAGIGILAIGVAAVLVLTNSLETAIITDTLDLHRLQGSIIPNVWFFLFFSIGILEVILFSLYNFLLREEASGGFMDRVFRHVVENGPVAIIFQGKDGTIMYESPSAKNVFGLTAKELVGRNILDFVHPEDREYVTNEYKELAQDIGATRTIQARFLYRDDTWHWMEATVTNMLKQPQVRSMVASLLDVTERLKEEENELVLSVKETLDK